MIEQLAKDFSLDEFRYSSKQTLQASECVKRFVLWLSNNKLSAKNVNAKVLEKYKQTKILTPEQSGLLDEYVNFLRFLMRARKSRRSNVNSERHSEAARVNGKLGGRPRKRLTDIPCTCKTVHPTDHYSYCLRWQAMKRRGVWRNSQSACEKSALRLGEMIRLYV